MPYDKYLVKDKDFEKKYDFTYLDIYNKRRKMEYLAQFKFYVSDHTTPYKDDMEELIKSAGGIVVEHYNNTRNKDDLILILDKQHDRELTKTLKQKGFRVFSTDLVLESVFSQELELNKTKFKL
jgi:hypothetical protein